MSVPSRAEAAQAEVGAAVMQPYRPRPIRFIECWSIEGWHLKVYGINAHKYGAEGIIARDVLDAAGPLVLMARREAGEKGKPEGYGFVVIHKGNLGLWLLIDWWSDGILLYQQVYRADLDEPTRFERINNGLVSCIWEMRVIAHESRAWTDAMLKAPASSQAYLSAQLNEDA